MHKPLLFLILISFILFACSAGPGDAAAGQLLPAGETAVPGALPPSQPPGLNRGLSGKLVLIQYSPQGNRLLELNLASGQVKELFRAPERSWLSAAAVSPNGQQILLAYAPPPKDDTPQFGFTDLYLLPVRGARTLKPFLQRTQPEESFFHPVWSPDGQSVYYTHLYRKNPEELTPAYQNDIERVTLASERQTLLENALWPAVSPDGARLSYLTVDETGLGNDLYIAGADGSSPSAVLKPGPIQPVDAHLFSADGDSLIFSMVNIEPTGPTSWLENLMGVRRASAHNVPSDWYRMPVTGGTPERLTNLNDLSLMGDISPDGDFGSYAAFISASGLYLMDMDGGEVFQVWPDLMVGTVDWIP